MTGRSAQVMVPDRSTCLAGSRSGAGEPISDQEIANVSLARISARDLQELSDRAPAGDWREIARNHRCAKICEVACPDNFAQRANWRWMLDLPRGSRILDLAAGLGANAHALALSDAEVFAVDANPNCVEFMRHRFAQEKLTNVHVGLNQGALPFARSSFDLAVMDYGFLGGFEKALVHFGAEPQSMREIYDLLKPGAYLYLTISGSFIFRNAALRRYCRHLSVAGFSSVKVFTILPDHTTPRFFVPRTASMFSYYHRNFGASPQSGLRRILRNVLRGSGVSGYLPRCFAIFAEKPGELS